MGVLKKEREKTAGEKKATEVCKEMCALRPTKGKRSRRPGPDETFLICSVCQEGTMGGLGANSLSLATQNVVWGLKKTVAMAEQRAFSSSVTKAVGKLVEFQSTSPRQRGLG